MDWKKKNKKRKEDIGKNPSDISFVGEIVIKRSNIGQNEKRYRKVN